MSVRISIPTALRALADGNNTLTVEAATVGEALAGLARQHPELGAKLLVDGDLRNFVNAYVNDDDVRYLQGLATPIGARDEISIIPAIAGGLGRVR